MKHRAQDVLLPRATREPERKRALVRRQQQICIRRIRMDDRQVCRIVLYGRHYRASCHLQVFRFVEV